MTDPELQTQLDRYKWYHTIPVTPTLSTPGVPMFANLHEPVLRAMSRLDFREKRVLDIGCRDGLFSLEAERLGAAEIEGIDSCLSLGAVEFLLPHLRSKVRMQERGLFELTPEKDGAFDVILFLGVLYHLRYPFQALQIITSVLKPGGRMIVETGIYADDDKRALLFCPIGEESPYEHSSTTFYNRKGMVDTLKSFGVRVDAIEYRSEKDRKAKKGEIIRGTFVCTMDAELLAKFPHAYWQGKSHGHWQK